MLGVHVSWVRHISVSDMDESLDHIVRSRFAEGNLAQLCVMDLRRWLQDRSVTSTGNKADLLARVESWLTTSRGSVTVRRERSRSPPAVGKEPPYEDVMAFLSEPDSDDDKLAASPSASVSIVEPELAPDEILWHKVQTMQRMDRLPPHVSGNVLWSYFSMTNSEAAFRAVLLEIGTRSHVQSLYIGATKDLAWRYYNCHGHIREPGDEPMCCHFAAGWQRLHPLAVAYPDGAALLEDRLIKLTLSMPSIAGKLSNSVGGGGAISRSVRCKWWIYLCCK